MILLLFLVGYLADAAELWDLMILSRGPPAFVNTRSISGLAFFSTKHLVIAAHVLFHSRAKPEVSEFSREKRLDNRVAKEVVLVSVEFQGGFLWLCFF